MCQNNFPWQPKCQWPLRYIRMKTNNDVTFVLFLIYSMLICTVNCEMVHTHTHTHIHTHVQTDLLSSYNKV